MIYLEFTGTHKLALAARIFRNRYEAWGGLSPTEHVINKITVLCICRLWLILYNVSGTVTTIHLLWQGLITLPIISFSCDRYYSVINKAENYDILSIRLSKYEVHWHCYVLGNYRVQLKRESFETAMRLLINCYLQYSVILTSISIENTVV